LQKEKAIVIGFGYLWISFLSAVALSRRASSLAMMVFFCLETKEAKIRGFHIFHIAAEGISCYQCILKNYCKAGKNKFETLILTAILYFSPN
jgi:hypothetical protein